MKIIIQTTGGAAITLNPCTNNHVPAGFAATAASFYITIDDQPALVRYNTAGTPKYIIVTIGDIHYYHYTRNLLDQREFVTKSTTADDQEPAKEYTRCSLPTCGQRIRRKMRYVATNGGTLPVHERCVEAAQATFVM
jgi:hypothetical protein